MTDHERNGQGRDVWLRLAHVGMHPDRLRNLLAERTAGAVLRSIATGRIEVPDHARAAARVSASVREEQLAAGEIAFVVRGDPGYPGALGELPDGPPFLFQRGAAGHGRAVAIVGTRTCTPYGRRLATAYGEIVSGAGWRVVSGLARGIDGAAHRGSLAGPVPGIVVLGSGIDVWYPSEHAELGEALLASGGTVWSESPPGTPPVGWRFPPRNRIISGVAEAVVVVEAAVKGGALITARTALEQGRDVLATPGDVGRPSSMGCNLLIRDGALPVHGADDLLETLDLLLGAPGSGPESPRSQVTSDDPTVDGYLAGLGLDHATLQARLGEITGGEGRS